MASTRVAAELMLETGEFYSGKTLGQALSITAKKASALLFNIRTSKLYETVDTGLPNRKLKVIAISGRKTSIRQLQNEALLFPRPSLLIGGR